MTKIVTFVLMIAGYFWIAVFGTGVKDVFQWPGLILIAAAFSSAFLALNYKKNHSGSSLCRFSVFVLFIYMISRAFSSPIIYEARLEMILFLVLFGFYILFSYLLVDDKYRMAFVIALLILACANTGIAIYQLDNPKFHILPGYDRVGRGDQLERPSGFYNASPHLGGFLHLASIMSAALFIFLKNKIGRLIFFLFFVTSTLGVVLSQSRGSIIALPLGLGIVFLFYLTFKIRTGLNFKLATPKIVFTILVGLCFTVALGAIFIKDNNGRIKSVDNFFEDSARANFRAAAVDQWTESPVIGTGSRTFQFKYLQYRPEHAPFHQMDPKFTHNDYFQQLAEYGLIGLGLVVFCLFVHLYNGIQMVRVTLNSVSNGASRLRFALLIGSIAALAAHSLHAVVDFHIRLLATAIPIVFCLSIISNFSMSIPSPKRKNFSLRVLPRWVIGTTGVTIIVLGVLIAPSSWKIQQARDYLRNGDSATAINFLHEASEMTPENPESFRELARLRYERLGEDIPAIVKVGYAENALNAYEKALDLNNLDWKSLLGAGVCEIFLAWHSTTSTSDEYWDRAKTFLDRAISIAPTKYEPREEYAYFQLNLAYYLAGKGDLEGAYREAVGAAKKFKAVPDYFVDGAPRGHRVAEGVRSTEELLKRLKKT